MIAPIKFAHPSSQLEEDLRSMEQPLLLLDNCLNAAASHLNAALDRFWAFPDERIEAILNHYGPQQVEVIFTAHAEKAAMVNELLRARGLNPTTKIGASREIGVDPENGRMFLKPIPVVIVEDPPEDNDQQVTQQEG